MEKLASRLAHNQEIVGSSPAAAIMGPCISSVAEGRMPAVSESGLGIASPGGLETARHRMALSNFVKPKGVVMAKKDSPAKGEQMQLIEVAPENLDKISPHVRKYREALKQRQAALKEEVKQKQLIQELVLAAKLQPLTNGHVKFRCEGFEIDLEPRDFVIHVKESKPPKKQGGEDAMTSPETKPDQGKPTEKQQKRNKRTVKSMQNTVTETEGQ